MIAESIKRDIRTELMLCESRKDIRRTFEAARKDFLERDVPIPRRVAVLNEIRGNLKAWIGHPDDTKSAELVLEAEMQIDALLLEYSSYP